MLKSSVFHNGYCSTTFPLLQGTRQGGVISPFMYRRLSLSQSPGDQTKYFEISVVLDSQPVTSFTFFIYMYVELHIACTCISQLCKYIQERNQYVEIICVYECEVKKEMSPIAHCVYILKNVCDQCLSCMPFPQVYL